MKIHRTITLCLFLLLGCHKSTPDKPASGTNLNNRYLFTNQPVSEQIVDALRIGFILGKKNDTDTASRLVSLVKSNQLDVLYIWVEEEFDRQRPTWTPTAK